MLPLIPQDKANHIAYGAAIATVTLVASLLLGVHQAHGALIAAGLVAIVGAAKEVMDRRDPAHTPEVNDFLATLAGGVLVALPAFVWGL